MNFHRRGIRAAVLGLLAAAGLALAPAAFAHTNWSIGINAPGVSVGYWGGHHHGGYVGVNAGYYGSGYYGGYYPTYYSAPAYYDYYPVERVYYTRPVYRHRYHHRYYSSCGCYR